MRLVGGLRSFQKFESTREVVASFLKGLRFQNMAICYDLPVHASSKRITPFSATYQHLTGPQLPAIKRLPKNTLLAKRKTKYLYNYLQFWGGVFFYFFLVFREYKKHTKTIGWAHWALAKDRPSDAAAGHCVRGRARGAATGVAEHGGELGVDLLETRDVGPK